MIGTGVALAIAVAIGFVILFSLAFTTLVLPLVSVVVPAILVLVSRRGSERARWSFAAGCFVASVTLLALVKVVEEHVPTGFSREEGYWATFAVWAAGVVAPWTLWLAFLVRNTAGDYGATHR